MEKFETSEQVNEAFAILNTYWNDLLSRYHVESKDPHVNRMANIWNQYQCMVTFNMSRSASYYESGTGRGMGFRDSCQDLLGFVHLIPERARERILDICNPVRRWKCISSVPAADQNRGIWMLEADLTMTRFVADCCCGRLLKGNWRLFHSG